MGDHLASLRAQGVLAEEDDEEPPELEPEIWRLWLTWRELHRARTAGAMSVNPLTFAEIDAYCRMTDDRLEPWEVRAIRRVDDLFMASLTAGDENGGNDG